MRLSFLLILILLEQALFGWGFFAHKTLNELSVYNLPAPLYSFYRKNIDQIISLAVKADQRRYIMEHEGARHYIDLDIYEKRLPLDSLPHDIDSAIATYGIDSLQTHGILPWNLERYFWMLVSAFKDKNDERIIKLSADLGHYIADAHVPLHTTSNYNGQQTNQHGIHGLWESRLTELYTDQWDLFTNKAEVIDNLDSLIWLIIEESHALVPLVLSAERLASDQFSSKYSYEMRGKQAIKVYHKSFCKNYNENLGNMIKERMMLSIWRCSSLWYTAWTIATQPALGSEQIEIQQVDSVSSVSAKTDRDRIH